jgi:hypothetical protein
MQTGLCENRGLEGCFQSDQHICAGHTRKVCVGAREQTLRIRLCYLGISGQQGRIHLHESDHNIAIVYLSQLHEVHHPYSIRVHQELAAIYQT